MEDYHGRTQLGVGEHDKMKKRLEEERHKDYQAHIRRKEMERTKQMESGDPHKIQRSETPTGSVADIGYETSLSIAHLRKQLNDTRRAEYVAHLASQSTSQKQVGRTAQNPITQQDSSPAESGNADRRQKQKDYADALREQIAERKRTNEQSKIQEKEQDKKNIEMARGRFIYGSNASLSSTVEE